MRVVGAQFDEAAVDDEGDAVDGDGGFGDVCADDYFAVVFGGGVKDCELGFAGEAGIEWEGEELRRPGVELGGPL